VDPSGGVPTVTVTNVVERPGGRGPLKGAVGWLVVPYLYHRQSGCLYVGASPDAEPSGVGGADVGRTRVRPLGSWAIVAVPPRCLRKAGRLAEVEDEQEDGEVRVGFVGRNLRPDSGGSRYIRIALKKPQKPRELGAESLYLGMTADEIERLEGSAP
jgi:hypothetical protein